MKSSLALLSLLSLLACSINPHVCAQNDIQKTYCDKAYKEYHYGVPFLHLEGTDYEVGYQYGYLLKDELHAVYEGFNDFKENMMEREIKYLPWYQRFFANLFGSLILKHKINKYVDQLPDDIHNQLKGMADGADMPVRFFYEVNLFGDYLSHGCSSFVIKKGSIIYHARNLDTPLNLIARYPVIVCYSINGRQKYTDIGFISGLMISTGFNESGISFSEDSNNNPMAFDKNNSNLLVERNRIITRAHNLKEADSLVNALLIPEGYIFTLSDSEEKQANVYDVIGKIKAATPVDGYQYVANRTISHVLGKKSESIYAGNFHDISREIKFSELIDTTKTNIVDEAIDILSNIHFYHYTDSIEVWIDAINNYQTIQSAIFDLADSAVYFAYNTHYAAWSRWLKYNYITGEVGVYREADDKLNRADILKFVDICKEYQAADWRDSTMVDSLVRHIIDSQIENYFCLDVLCQQYLYRFKAPDITIAHADKMIKKYPDVVTGYYYKGLALEEQKQYGNAITQYMKAFNCTICCEYYLAGVCEHLAYSNNFLGNKEIAKEYAVKALAIHNQYWIPDHLKEKIEKLEKIAAIDSKR